MIIIILRYIITLALQCTVNLHQIMFCHKVHQMKFREVFFLPKLFSLKVFPQTINKKFPSHFNQLVVTIVDDDAN